MPRLRTPLEVWSPLRTSDGHGGSDYNKSNVRTVWGAMQIQAANTVLIVGAGESIKIGDMVTVSDDLMGAPVDIYGPDSTEQVYRIDRIEYVPGTAFKRCFIVATSKPIGPT